VASLLVFSSIEFYIPTIYYIITIIPTHIVTVATTTNATTIITTTAAIVTTNTNINVYQKH
jgi:hypothetical protein